MFILDTNGKIHTDIKDIESFLGKDNFAVFSKVLAENKIAESAFLNDSSASVIILDESNILLCHKRDLAGLRYILLVPKDMDYSLLTEKAWDLMETAGHFAEADLVQVLVPISEYDRLSTFKNVLTENLIFEKDVSQKSDINQDFTTKIDFTNKEHMQKLAELEFLTRLEFSSSTFRPKDHFSLVLEEYLSMGVTPGMGGVCIENDPMKGFMIWWSMPEKQSSMGIHLWVSEKQRGHGYGKKLLSAMINQLHSENIKTCRCFVSALNLNIIKTFISHGFKLNYFVSNRFLK